MMHADGYFTTGKTHVVCEDYALADNNKGYPLVLLSDGCSSSKYTDVGARILTHCCRNRLKSVEIFKMIDREHSGDMLHFYDKYIRQIIWIADLSRKNIGLPEECLDATLLAAVTLPGEVIVTVAGDGIFALRDPKNQILRIFQIEYSTNAPYYMSYQLDPQRDENFHRDFSPVKQITEITLDLKTGKIKDITKENSKESISYWHFYKSDYDVVALFSDGIETFRLSSHSYTVPTYEFHEVVKELFEFKTLKGNFVQRRCKRFLKNCVIQKAQHDDDFSMAAIYLGD